MSPDSAAASIEGKLEGLRANALVNMRDGLRTLEESVKAIIEERLTDQDLAAATTAAHKIAGKAGMFGFPSATEAARQLEMYLTDGAALGGATTAAALVAKLRSSLGGDVDRGDWPP